MQDFKRHVCLAPGSVEELQQGQFTLAFGLWQVSFTLAVGCDPDGGGGLAGVKAAGPCSALTFRTGGRGEVSNGTGPGGFRSSGQRRGFARVPGTGHMPHEAQTVQGGASTPPHPL